MTDRNKSDHRPPGKDVDDVDVHTEAVVFDLFADDEDHDGKNSDDSPDVHTEAVQFDPFADDDDGEDDDHDGDAEDTDVHTEAVPFDPFADEDEETTGEVETFPTDDPDELSLIHI